MIPFKKFGRLRVKKRLKKQSIDDKDTEENVFRTCFNTSRKFVKVLKI